MDPVRNPFVPGAGNQPPELAGRSAILEQIRISLQRVKEGRHAKSSILIGLRGVGKTVLLVRMREMAEEIGYKAHSIEAHDGKSLIRLIVPALKAWLLGLSRIENAKEKARRGLRVMKSFVNGVQFKFGDLEIGLSVDPEVGSADSGDLETDLPNLFVAVGEAARAASQPVALFIDELQYISHTEFSALIMSVHRLNQLNLPFMLIGAGLPQIPGLAGESKSYAERLFRYPPIGALADQDAKLAILKPAQAAGGNFTDHALSRILTLTERYPYFIQQWAHDSWNLAQGQSVTEDDVEAATPVSISVLDEDFFKVRFDRCNASEKKYMKALASFGPGIHKSGEVAAHLGVKTTSKGPTRDKLIKKGMIYAPQHGEVAFTVPMFDSYMNRVIKDA